MQYRTGTVTVTNGSNVVAGTGTAWLGQVEDGDLFFVAGDNVVYEVSSVPANGSLTLSTPYEGVGAAGASYAISRDFTPLCGFPYPDANDIGTALLFRRAMMALDTAVNATVKGSPSVQSITTTVPPATASASEFWVVPPGATGAWAGQTNNLAQLVGSVWAFTAPEPGNRVWVLDQTLEMLFTGTAWVDSTAGLPQVLAAVTSAQTAATTATTALTQVQAAVTTVSQDVTAAAGSATTATTAATAAATSATNAAGSATTAQTAETAAQAAQTAASTSATAAAASAADAETSAISAEGAVTSASGYATAAQVSATAAAASATTAGTYATTAGTAATGAANSAAAAANSATTSNSAALAATASENNAATSATQAATSATAALTSQGGAQASATAAAQSETDAASSAQISEAYATTPHNVQVAPGAYSSLHWATEAAQSAAQAALIAGGNNIGSFGDGSNLRYSAAAPSSLFNLTQGSGITLAWAGNGVTFSANPSQIDHQALLHAGTLTHAQIDSSINSLNTTITTLAPKATTLAGYGITDAVNVSLLAAANGVATLGADGKVLAAQLPAFTINEVYPVASQAAMLALAANVGDVAVRSDLGVSFMLSQTPATTLANWVEMSTPNQVTSVAGRQGTITLTFADIGGLATVASTGSYASLTGLPTLGTAAALNAGTAATNLVQLDSQARLPAVDGSQLTNVTAIDSTARSRAVAMAIIFA